MNDKRITYITDVSLITCIVSVGRGDAVIQAARELGATAAVSYRAQGLGPRERLGLLGIAVETDKEVVNLLVPSEHEEIIFETVCRAGQLSTPGSGMAYMTRLDKLATFVPRDILERVQGPEGLQ